MVGHKPGTKGKVLCSGPTNQYTAIKASYPSGSHDYRGSHGAMPKYFDGVAPNCSLNKELKALTLS